MSGGYRLTEDERLDLQRSRSHDARLARLLEVRRQSKGIAAATLAGYKRALSATRRDVEQGLRLEWERDKENAAAGLRTQLAECMGRMGEGHRDAGRAAMADAANRAAEGGRARAWAARARRRGLEAVHRAREERSAQGREVRTMVCCREAAKVWERDLAAKAGLERQKQEEVNRSLQAAHLSRELVRKRREQHSLVDFRFSRLHQQLGVPQVAVKHVPSAGSETAVQAAVGERNRFAEGQQIKSAADSDRAAAAHKRGHVALLRETAKSNAQVVVAALAHLRAEKLQQRQKRIASGDLSGAPLLRSWRHQQHQTRLEKAFERVFMDAHESCIQPLERPLPQEDTDGGLCWTQGLPAGRGLEDPLANNKMQDDAQKSRGRGKAGTRNGGAFGDTRKGPPSSERHTQGTQETGSPLVISSPSVDPSSTQRGSPPHTGVGQTSEDDPMARIDGSQRANRGSMGIAREDGGLAKPASGGIWATPCHEVGKAPRGTASRILSGSPQGVSDDAEQRLHEFLNSLSSPTDRDSSPTPNGCHQGKAKDGGNHLSKDAGDIEVCSETSTDITLGSYLGAHIGELAGDVSLSSLDAVSDALSQDTDNVIDELLKRDPYVAMGQRWGQKDPPTESVQISGYASSVLPRSFEEPVDMTATRERSPSPTAEILNLIGDEGPGLGTDSSDSVGLDSLLAQLSSTFDTESARPDLSLCTTHTAADGPNSAKVSCTDRWGPQSSPSHTLGADSHTSRPDVETLLSIARHQSDGVSDITGLESTRPRGTEASSSVVSGITDILKSTALGAGTQETSLWSDADDVGFSESPEAPQNGGKLAAMHESGQQSSPSAAGLSSMLDTIYEEGSCPSDAEETSLSPLGHGSEGASGGSRAKHGQTSSASASSSSAGRRLTYDRVSSQGAASRSHGHHTTSGVSGSTTDPTDTEKTIRFGTPVESCATPPDSFREWIMSGGLQASSPLATDRDARSSERTQATTSTTSTSSSHSNSASSSSLSDADANLASGQRSSSWAGDSNSAPESSTPEGMSIRRIAPVSTAHRSDAGSQVVGEAEGGNETWAGTVTVDGRRSVGWGSLRRVRNAPDGASDGLAETVEATPSHHTSEPGGSQVGLSITFSPNASPSTDKSGDTGSTA